MNRDWTASFSIRFRNGTCIIILDKKYNIANSSCHFGSYGSIWNGRSPKKYYNDLRSFGPFTICLVTGRSIYCLRSFGPYNIVLVTDRSIYYHVTFKTICYLSLFLKCERHWRHEYFTPIRHNLTRATIRSYASYIALMV